MPKVMAIDTTLMRVTVSVCVCARTRYCRVVPLVPHTPFHIIDSLAAAAAEAVATRRACLSDSPNYI